MRLHTYYTSYMISSRSPCLPSIFHIASRRESYFLQLLTFLGSAYNLANRSIIKTSIIYPFIRKELIIEVVLYFCHIGCNIYVI